MPPHVFVTGTDTEVGKTVVAAGLLSLWRERYKTLYWKPIQTGTSVDRDAASVKRLACAAPDEIADEIYCYPEPLSPHLVARMHKRPISLDVLREKCDELKRRAERLIVEGAGGLLVPVTETETMVDLVKALNIPVLIVSRAGLGTINHTVLTLRAARECGISVWGVVMCGGENSQNAEAIEQYGGAKVLAQIPRIEDLEKNLARVFRENFSEPQEGEKTVDAPRS
ncbi:MAG: dethiobiotin synthase [Acidobacteriota bacterium]|nr:MAG: dethiobiotin synthase [Acidobacteriota bacterium]